MSKYYCYKCARDNGHVSPVDPMSLMSNEYQLEKFIKHTAPTGVYPTNSVFHEKDWATYHGYIVTTSASGCLEVDDRGRSNLIYFAGEETGLRYDNGLFICPCSGVKLVCGVNASGIHAFPSDFQPESRICADCGKKVPVDPR